MATVEATITRFGAMNAPARPPTRPKPFMATVEATITRFDAMNAVEGGRGMIVDRWLER
jgi:hypothetical protein